MADYTPIDFLSDDPDIPTLKDLEFIDELLSNGNHKNKAAIKVYGCETDNIASTIAHKILLKPAVGKIYNRRMNDKVRASGISMDWIEGQLEDIATTTIQDYYDENGKQIPIHKLSEKAAGGVSSVEIEYVDNMRREKLKTYDRSGALKTLASIRKPIAQHKMEITGKDGKPINVEVSGGVLALPSATNTEGWADDASESQDAVLAVANEGYENE